jgi:hypothetical protein
MKKSTLDYITVKDVAGDYGVNTDISLVTTHSKNLGIKIKAINTSYR